MKSYLKKSDLWSFVTVIFYRIILDISYYFVVSRFWGYEGFAVNPTAPKMIESYFLTLLIFWLMPKASKKISDILAWFFTLMAYLPLLTVYVFSDESRLYVYGATFMMILLFVSLKLFKTPTIPSLNKKQAQFVNIAMFFALAVLVLAAIYLTTGFFWNFDLSKVYEIRANFVKQNIPFADHIFDWLALLLNPLFFAIFLKKKKWLAVAGTVVLELVLFSVTGVRIFLFALPFVYFIGKLVKTKNPLAYAAAGLSIILLAGMFFSLVFGSLLIDKLFSYRTIFEPALISFFYYHFFSINGLTYLSQHSLLNELIHYPYDLSPPSLIGLHYYGTSDAHANNGLFSDAYMNFGFLGFFIWPFLLALFLKLADVCSRDRDKGLVLAVLGISVIIFTNVELLTSLFTNGLLLGVGMVYLLPKQS